MADHCKHGIERCERCVDEHTSQLTETLAAIEHERWSGWMAYLFTKGVLNADGSFTIDPQSVERWERQVATPYAGLSEKEKESDRIEVRKTLAAIGGADAAPTCPTCGEVMGSMTSRHGVCLICGS